MAIAEDKRQLARRVTVLQGVVAGTFLLLGGSFWFFQVGQYTRYKEMAENNHQRTLAVRAPRGVIFDREGRVIVENRNSFNISILREHSKDLERTITRLADVTHVSADTIREIVARHRHEPIAGHLIACSVLAAPASLVVAKLMLPELESSRAGDPSRLVLPRTASGLLDALTVGTTDGLKLAANVGAMLISFLALTALVDFVLGAASGPFMAKPLTLEALFSLLFSPLAFALGVSVQDVPKVASLLGQKTVLNEFVAYSTLSRELASDPLWLTERSRVIVSYALCGFANFGSIGIQIGGYASLAPERRADLARLGPRAMLAGLLSTCLVACIAGLFL